MIEWLLGSLALSGAVVAGRRFWLAPDRQVRRALRSTRARAIARVRDGRVVKIAGAVELDGPPVTAPLSGIRGAYYLLVVEEQRTSPAGATSWVEVVRQEQRRELFVRDATGRARVVLDGATIAVGRDIEGIAELRAPPAELVAVLREHGLDLRSSGAGNKWLRYQEGVLEVGESIAVAGLARWEPDPNPSPSSGGPYRDLPMRAALRVSGDLPLLVSDDPKTLR